MSLERRQLIWRWMEKNQSYEERTLALRRPLGPPPGFEPINEEDRRYADLVLNLESLLSD